jgi:hypothetical protein
MNSIKSIKYCFFVALLFYSVIIAQNESKGKTVSKPLYDDPVCHGDADPEYMARKANSII